MLQRACLGSEQQPESPVEIKGVEKDKDGKCLIMLDTVRQEIVELGCHHVETFDEEV